MVNPWAVSEHLWTQPGMPADKRAELTKQNLASLNRKITYCLKRPDVKLYFQEVEGWTSAQILEYMESRGITRERILKNLHRTSDW
jgi:hypothetical protein